MSSWEIKRLDELVLFASGGTPSKARTDYWVGNIPWISAATMHQQEIYTSDLFISEDGVKAGSKLAKSGDLLLLVRGSMLWKKIPICICMRDVAFNQDVKSIKTNENLMSEFLLYWFLSHEKNLLHKVVGTGIGAGKLDFDSIKSLLIPVPPLSEQKQIVSMLEQWDAAIDKTEALIDAKGRQFAWLQNILIKESSDEWLTKPLNSLSQIKKGKQLNRDTLDDSAGYPVWNGGITPSGYTDKSNTASNTITISEGGNSCGFVNFCKEDFWLGGHCYAVENLDSSLDPDFLFFCLKANERRIMRLRVGSGLPNIQKKDIEKLQIQFPPIDEQKRIAHTLNTAQKEITLLKKLADQYRTQKRGLMQKLLSGEWHIKNKETA